MAKMSNDESIKKMGELTEWTPELIKELQLCKNDIYEFIKYVKIVTLDEGRVNFKPYDFQKDILDLIQRERFVIFKCARQLGKTTIISIDALHYGLFNNDKYIGIAANNASMATEILDRIKITYEELPHWLKPGIKMYNQTSITFENGTKIVVRPCSPNAFRGRSCSRIILDEFAFIQPKLGEQFWLSNYPTVSSSKDAKIIIVSTPNGMTGLFYELWQDSEKGRNLFKCYNADWTAHPDRDEQWAKDQLNTIGEQRFSQEFAVNFLGSSSTVINPVKLRDLLDIKDEPIAYGLFKSLRIYRESPKHRQYVIGVDTGKGTGNDSSVIQVAEVLSTHPLKIEQVAVYQDNMIDTYLFAEIVFKIATIYNNAYVVVENNECGDTIIKRLHFDFEYEWLVNEGAKTDKMGVRATKKSKPRAVLLMKKLIEEDNFILHDKPTIKQLSHFVEEDGHLRGQDKSHDDMVSALYWLAFAFTFDLFDESVDIISKRNLNAEFDEPWGVVSGEDEGLDQNWLANDNKRYSDNEDGMRW